MGEKRERPPTWREVVTVLLAIEAGLERLAAIPRLHTAAKLEVQTLLVSQVRPLLRRAAR